MNFDFPTLLVLATIFTGVVSLIDVIFDQAKKIKGAQANANVNVNTESSAQKKPWLIDYSRSFFPVLLIVLLIRSFIAQPYRVPTQSLEPTVMPGDFIFVSQYNYGLRLPAWNKKIFPIGEPKVGQIALFFWPVNHRATFVKRVIGVPGDQISYINNVLYVNGKAAPHRFLGYAMDRNDVDGPTWKVAIYEENLNGVKHKIYLCTKDSFNCPNPEIHNFYNLRVPAGKYFMMGDNRNDSDDSRDWGFVSENELIGRARFVWMNWNSFADHWYQRIWWQRIGVKL